MKTESEILFGLVDVTAKKDSQLTVNDKQDFVNLDDLKKDDLSEVKYATCEKNQFCLNGTFELMPEELNNMGWWSNKMSDENGNFDAPLILEINFNEEVHSSLGLTFIFSKAGDYCNNLNIKYYDLNNNLISDVNFTPDSYKYVCNEIVENYKRIVITFYSTNNPFRYLKLYKILYGAEKTFSTATDTLVDSNILEEIDLLSSEISINTLDFTTYSESDEFNIINPRGIYSLLQQRQKFKVTEKVNYGEKEIDMGSFYLDSWSNEKDKTMKFNAIDLIGVIDKTDFNGGMYHEEKVENVISEIMTSAKLTKDDYEIEECLKNKTITGYIPICSHREALQQVLFVIGAVADCSRSEKIKIYSVYDNEETENIIKKDNKFEKTTKIDQNELVTGVSIIVHNYIKSNEYEEIYTGSLSSGKTTIQFNDPTCDLVSETPGVKIVESNCNYAILHCESDIEEAIIMGHKYNDSQQTFINEIESISSSEKLNTLKVESAYLVNKNNVQEVSKRILDHYKGTYIISFDFLIDKEKVSEDVIVESDFEQQLIGHITKLDVNLSGGFMANLEMLARVKERNNG